jgi:hypothetical protein
VAKPLGVVINFWADTKDAVRDINKLTRETQGLGNKSKAAGGKLKGMAKAGLAGVAAGAAGAAVALWDMTDAAVADAASASRLARSLKNVTGATDAQVAAVEEWITAQGAAFGVADDELRPALDRLARSTEDITEAQKLASLAMDISASTGKDLQTVAEGLAKANDGNINALKRMGVSLGENAENAVEYNKHLDTLTRLQQRAATALEEYGPASKEYKTAMQRVADQQAIVNGLAEDGIDWQAELAETFKGAAESQADSAEGAMARVKLAFDEAQEAIGYAFLPTVEEAARFLASDDGRGAMEDFAASVASIAEAFLATVRAIGQLNAKWNELPEWMRKLLTTPIWKLPDPRVTGPGGTVWQKTPPKEEPKPFGSTSYAPTIIINNPKPERSSDSVASALRTDRYVSRRTGGY